MRCRAFKMEIDGCLEGSTMIYLKILPLVGLSTVAWHVEGSSCTFIAQQTCEVVTWSENLAARTILNSTPGHSQYKCRKITSSTNCSLMHNKKKIKLNFLF